MSDLSGIRAQLARWHQQLLASHAFVAGRPDSDTKAAEEMNRLQQIAGGLEIILRDLKSSESSLRARENQLRKIPLQQRFSAEQSLKQLTENVQAVRKEAQELADLVRDLLERNGLLNPVQKAKDLIDLAKDLDKVLGNQTDGGVTQVLYVPKETTLGPFPPATSHLSVSGVAGLIAFVYLGIKVLQKKYASKTTSA